MTPHQYGKWTKFVEQYEEHGYMRPKKSQYCLGHVFVGTGFHTWIIHGETEIIYVCDPETNVREVLKNKVRGELRWNTRGYTAARNLRWVRMMYDSA